MRPPIPLENFSSEGRGGAAFFFKERSSWYIPCGFKGVRVTLYFFFALKEAENEQLRRYGPLN
jgi:hypothetical protein